MASPHPNPRLATDSTVTVNDSGQRIPGRMEYVTVFLEHWLTFAIVHTVILSPFIASHLIFGAISRSDRRRELAFVAAVYAVWMAGTGIALVAGIFNAVHGHAGRIKIWREINVLWYTATALILGHRLLGVYLSNADVFAAIVALSTSPLFYGLTHLVLDVYDSVIADAISLESERPASKKLYVRRMGHSIARRRFHRTPSPRQGATMTKKTL
ncbi:hypothetical protein OG21DRAFT_90534 [Imleria badia]|nr:hypothetical protein OG21DRAFT_90534 [Imleria badia]